MFSRLGSFDCRSRLPRSLALLGRHFGIARLLGDLNISRDTPYCLKVYIGPLFATSSEGVPSQETFRCPCELCYAGLSLSLPRCYSRASRGVPSDWRRCYLQRGRMHKIYLHASTLGSRRRCARRTEHQDIDRRRARSHMGKTASPGGAGISVPIEQVARPRALANFTFLPFWR